MSIEPDSHGSLATVSTPLPCALVVVSPSMVPYRP